MLDQILIMLIQPTFLLYDLVVQTTLLIFLNIKPAMDALIILSQFILLRNQSIVHFIQGAHEF